MNRAGQFQIAANLATLVNALLGVNAIAYTLAGNKLFGLLLILGAIGFDGLDGMLHREGGGPSTVTGRVLDSAADGVSFALAPAIFVAVHRFAATSYGPYDPFALAVGLFVGGCAVARLVWFTLRGHRRPYFVGASTPQTTLAIVVLVLFFDQPGYLGPQPFGFLLAAFALAPLMVLPIPYPKIRRGAPLRRVVSVASFGLALALLVEQFGPPRGSFLYLAGELGAIAAAAGVALFYVLGPALVHRVETPAVASGADA